MYFHTYEVIFKISLFTKNYFKSKLINQNYIYNKNIYFIEIIRKYSLTQVKTINYILT